MKASNIKLFLLGLVMLAPFSCKEDFLIITPNANLGASILATKDGVNTLLIGAYSMVDGVASNGFGWEAASSNWVYGSIRGLEANKGTDSGDQPDINPLQTYSETATNPYLDVKWASVYDGIARANETLKVLAAAEENGTVTADEADSFRRQARTLRGYFHFEAWRMWDKICYVDETTDLEAVTNQEDVRDKILDDLEAGIALPNDMGQVGRFNGTVARVLLAKGLMQMNRDFAGAMTHLQSVISNGTGPDGHAIGLEPKYGEIFDTENRNGMESIYTIQYSVNDGSGGWNGGWGEVLNFPYKSGASPGGCCGFFQPSHDLVNSFLTTNGLPILNETYNSNPVVNDQGLTVSDPFTPETRPLDPRLDWTVGRRGIPYLDWGPHTGQDWVRDQSYAGPYSPKKQVYKKAQEGTETEVGNWTSGWTTNGYRLIRYADVLLLLAECQIETNDLAGARTNINLIRARAANSEGFVKNDDGSDAANYQISQYPAAGAPFDSQANARVALQMERKLELGMEGHRFFDLQRWGNVEQELNRVLTYERTELPTLYQNATSVGSEDKLFPVPQSQIDLMGGRLVQNR
ncbi:MAG TPA: RagB/SusD family nutrient uptake outer membrane protein [Saprospiraceae bacterium]|nr:RagB/SusD family nutrient uptake outer membrane protein [Saprospiraceae bacterium]